LDVDARRDLARRALRDPQLAAELKLALRLADGSAELARDWIGAAAPATAPVYHWWRPLAGAAASLAIVAAVLGVHRMNETQNSTDVVAVQAHTAQPDRIGAAGSFEATELFGGSFERD
jgi:hypothetical protein